MRAFIIIIILLVLMCFVSLGCSMFRAPVSITERVSENLTPETLKLLTKTNLLCAAGIIIMGIGAFGAAKLKDWGFPAIVGGITIVVTSIATAQYAKWIAIFGIIFMIATMAITFILKLKKAITQIVNGIQRIKKSKAITKKEINNVLAGCQDKDTQKIVAKTKTDLKIKGEI